MTGTPSALSTTPARRPNGRCVILASLSLVFQSSLRPRAKRNEPERIPFLKLRDRLIDPFMHRPPAQLVKVLVKGLFDVNQRTLPGAVAIVLQCGDHDEISVGPRWNN